MKNYIATVRIKGQLVKTMVHAENSIHARLILQYRHGMDCVMSNPVLAENTESKTSDQLRIDSLKNNKDRATDALAAERQRQKVAKAQQALVAVHNARNPLKTK
jgi:hypothetical protein